jgi:biopolymer transport protein ExbD
MAASLGGQEGEEEITGINVTPFVDIVLVLLIIFMVTANFIVRETMEVDLPRAANAGETVQGLVNVGARVAAGAREDPLTRAVISADQSLPYGRIMHLIDVVKGEGISRFALNIEKEARASAPATPP